MCVCVCILVFQIDGSGGHYKLFADGTLQIIGLYKYDSGVYICMASNGIGEPIRKEVYLTVKGTSFIVFVFNTCALYFGILQYVFALVDYRYSYNIGFHNNVM